MNITLNECDLRTRKGLREQYGKDSGGSLIGLNYS